MEFGINKTNLNKYLTSIASSLDITESMYKSLEQSYKAVGEYLSGDEILSSHNVEIHPQGSLLLGTAIRPISDDGDVDIDLVCEIRRKEPAWTQKSYKNLVGNRLKDSNTYEPMLEPEGRRCWTIDYRRHSENPQDRYHLDVLPAVFNHGMSLHQTLNTYASLRGIDLWDKLSMCLTDTKTSGYTTDTELIKWQKTNPFGYAIWFEERCKTSVGTEGVIMMRSKVSPMRPYSNEKLPLQRVVQLLKRHRDIKFGEDEDRPISIIITTLAAYAYNGETDIATALQRIACNIEFNLKRDASGHYLVQNPVNPEENFADKWPEHPEREIKFFNWLRQLKEDVEYLYNSSTSRTQMFQKLKSSFGDNIVNDIIAREAEGIKTASDSGTLKMTTTGVLGTVGSITAKANTFYGR